MPSRSRQVLNMVRRLSGLRAFLSDSMNKMMQSSMRRAMVLAGCLAPLLYCVAVHAGDRAWTQERASPAINYKNVAVAARYVPDASGALSSQSRITRIQASRSFESTARIQTLLCWNSTTRCVRLNGNNVSTHQFDGLDANQPLYLVHTALGDKAGPLPSPVFVKGSVVVWYAP